MRIKQLSPSNQTPTKEQLKTQIGGLVEKTYILVLDEPETRLHPELARNFIQELMVSLFQYRDKKFQVILASHSPFLRGDIPKENVIILERIDGKSVVKKSEHQTFSRNIHTLLEDAFFMDATIGEFSRRQIQKVNKMLDDAAGDWETVKKYHKQFPEFTIEYTLDDNGNGYQYYLFNQTDITPHWREIRLYYHQTLLYSTEAVSLDGGRYFTPTPFTDGISFDNYHNWDVMFKYFIEDSLEYTLHKFYYEPDGDEEDTAHRRFRECILLFSHSEEKELFKQYVSYVWRDKEKYSQDIWTPYFPQIEGLLMEGVKKDYINAQILKRVFEEFKCRDI